MRKWRLMVDMINVINYRWREFNLNDDRRRRSTINELANNNRDDDGEKMIDEWWSDRWTIDHGEIEHLLRMTIDEEENDELWMRRWTMNNRWLRVWREWWLMNEDLIGESEKYRWRKERWSIPKRITNRWWREWWQLMIKRMMIGEEHLIRMNGMNDYR